MNQPITCLLIDDDTDDQEIFAIALEDIDEAIRFVTAGSWQEALEKLNADKTFIPDFIFIDLNMPRMSGKHCLTEIKKINRLRHVPLIIYSTSSDSRDIEEVKTLGATDYIVKSSSINSLISILEKVFGRGKSHI